MYQTNNQPDNIGDRINWLNKYFGPANETKIFLSVLLKYIYIETKHT